MAQKRSVELQIRLQNVNSVGELQDLLKEVNNEIKEVSPNSEAFKELAQVSQKAQGQLKNVREELAGISDSKQIQSIGKMGTTIASSFTLAQSAVLLFGNTTGEQLQKAINTGVQLQLALTSIKNIMDGLSASNLKAFRTMITGFNDSLKASQAFGAGTRAVLLTTGIGALVVGLGLVVAYWDDIKKAIGLAGDEQEKYLADQKRIADVQRLQNKALQDQLSLEIEIARIKGASTIQIIEKEIILNQEKIKGLEAQIRNLDKVAETKSTTIKFDEQTLELLEKTSRKTREELESISEIKVLSEEQKEIQEQINELKTRGIILQEQLKQSVKETNQAEADRALRIKDLNDEIARAQEERERARQEKELADLVTHLQKKKELFINVEAEIESETVDSIGITREKELAILRNTALVKEQIEKDLNKKIRDEQIKHFEELGELTEEQEQVLKDLKIEKFKEYVDEIRPFVDATMNGISQISQALTTALQTQIQNLQTQLQSVDILLQESIQERMSLEAQLHGAQGTAREQILQAIETEKQKERQLFQDKKRLQNEIIKAQNKTNEVNFINSIIKSVVDTISASVSALPNIPLSILVGILGGIGTGVIASNKPQPIPLMRAVGGFTGNGGKRDHTGERQTKLVQLHENEWVASRAMTEHPLIGGIISQLEAIRQTRFMADGGFPSGLPTISPNLSNGGGMTAQDIKTAIEGARIYTSWTEGREVGTNVEYIESRSSV